jgi:Fur family transcriptional regulator, ferric uptake regulator
VTVVPLEPVTVAQSPEDRFREYLASRPEPKRFTDQQRQLVAHIFAQHSHFDADQLLDDLKVSKKEISRATVYRTLAELVKAGLLKKIEIGPRTIYDHDYGYPQHEHLVCDQCKTMIEFQNDEIEAILLKVAAEHRFRAEGHTLVVRGICGPCNAANAARRRPYVM